MSSPVSSSVDHLPEAMQPIMCCLGERVAGKPTQFMWERAIAAGQLDWRAITIQLAAQDLPVALAGMYAMRIMGLRFFPSLQTAALQHLAADQERLLFIGRVTSAVREPHAWHAWHNWGGTILAWSAQQTNLRHAVCWLHGDSVECRSVWVAILEGVAAGAELPLKVLWSEAPPDVTPRWDVGAEVQLVPLESIEHAAVHIEDLQAQVTSDSDTPGQSSSQLPAAPVLLLVGEQLAGGKVLGTGKQAALSRCVADAAVHCLVAGGALAIQQAQAWKHSRLQIMTLAEQIVACEAYDFKRCTGSSVASHVLRDAYDEYNGFE